MVQHGRSSCTRSAHADTIYACKSVADQIELGEEFSAFVLLDVKGNAMTVKEADEDPRIAARYEELLAVHL
ncbi:hypothetical protein, partial [uncultured Bradyrhizobium sp.]|uniref:hypothetical protein n=1 Tax=uncultured Bradyrhizobium sp. TaxID=199684 RepID=UPI002639279D